MAHEDDLAARVLALYNEGRRVQDIAFEVGASRRQVLSWLERAGIEVKLSDRTWIFGKGPRQP